MKRKLKETCHLIFYEDTNYYEMLHKLTKRQRTPEAINKFVENQLRKYDNNSTLLDDFYFPMNDNMNMIKGNLVYYLKEKNLKLPSRIFDMILVSSLIDIYLEIGYGISFEMYSSDWWEAIDKFFSNQGRINRKKLYSILINAMNLRNYSKNIVQEILVYLFQKKDIKFDYEEYNKPITISAKDGLWEDLRNI
jgi:hypothetical protein